MNSVEDNFKHVLAKFTTRLTKQELNDFKFSSLEDVLASVQSIQAEQGRRKEMMNLTRIQRFLEAMGQYGQVIEVFLNTSSILCFVWGPMKFCLQVASTWADSFDILLDAYKQLAENIPLLGQYQHLFRSDPRMTSVLAIIFEDILEFHQVALRVFKQSTWKHLFKSAWKDFKTSFQHILDDLSRHKLLVESQANLIQIQEAQADRAFIRNQFKMAEDANRQKRYLDVMNWLSAADSVIDQEAAARVRSEVPSTGQWILQDAKVKAWADPNSSFIPILWMNGIPGAGKTILTSVIVAECLRLDISIVYFYCSYQDVQRRTFLAVAKALLAQILCQSGDQLLPYLYDKFIGSGQVTLASQQLASECLELCLTTMPKTYIIIDGIDECDLAERNSILSFFVSLAAKTDTPGKMRILFVSQDLNDIRRILRTATAVKLTDKSNKDDIEAYTAKWIQNIRARFKISDMTADYIRTAVSDGAEGMFLFAKLVLTNLCAQVTIEKLYKELEPETFPKGFEQAYSRIVIRVYENSNIGELEVAKKVLGWVACSKRSLSWHEIQAALSIDTDDQTINIETRRLCPDVRDICGSLVDIVSGGRVQLVHSTAKLYLIHNNYVQMHHEERKLAVLCLQYLLFDCFDSTLPEEKIREHIIQGDYAFQEYSVLHWVDHLEASLPYLPSEAPEEDSTINSAINEFEEAYGSTNMDVKDVSEQLKKRCQHIENANYFSSLVLLLEHTRKHRGKEETIAGLGDLGTSINKNRSILENLLPPGSSDPTLRLQLEQYYGSRWYKCPRHACPYFYTGFPDYAARDSHLFRHEKPYLCTLPSCPRIYLGFSTEKELKKHIRVNHPDPAALFPKLKKNEPTKHVCDICSKDFTRAHNLKAHKRTHANDRPHKCTICTKAFVRKHDLDRHVNKLHPGKKAGEELSQENQPTSSLNDEGISLTGVNDPPSEDHLAITSAGLVAPTTPRNVSP